MLYKRKPLELEDTMLMVLDVMHQNVLHVLFTGNSENKKLKETVESMFLEYRTGLERVVNNAYFDLAPMTAYNIEDLIKDLDANKQWSSEWNKRETVKYVEVQLHAVGMALNVKWEPQASLDNEEYK